MARLNFSAASARRTEGVDHLAREQSSDDRFASIPGHLHAAAVMREVIEVEADLVRIDAHDVAELREEPRLSIRGEAHHFVFVAVLSKAQELGKGGIKQAEGVRVRHRAANV